MSGKAPAHGTYAGFQRHRRNKDQVCEPCAQARRDYDRERKARKREERSREQRERDVDAVLAALDEDVEKVDRSADLREQRRILKAALEGLLATDPARLPAISKELREVNREIDALEESSKVAGGGLSEFFAGSTELATVSEIHTA